MSSHSIAGNTLGANGDVLQCLFGLISNSVAHNRTIRVYLGSVKIFEQANIPGGTSFQSVRVHITRTASNAFKALVEVLHHNSVADNTYMQNNGFSLDLTTAQTLRLTVQVASGANGEATILQEYIAKIPA
jgi:hypothetical protein